MKFQLVILALKTHFTYTRKSQDEPTATNVYQIGLQTDDL